MNKTFLTCLNHHHGAFEQLFCPGGGAFANLFSKNPNSRRDGSLLELTDA